MRNPELFIVGQAATLTCTSDLDDATALLLLDRDGMVVASAENSQSVILNFDPVSDSIDSMQYTCRVVTPAGNQDQLFNIIVEGIHVLS